MEFEYQAIPAFANTFPLGGIELHFGSVKKISGLRSQTIQNWQSTNLMFKFLMLLISFFIIGGFTIANMKISGEYADNTILNRRRYLKLSEDSNFYFSLQDKLILHSAKGRWKVFRDTLILQGNDITALGIFSEGNSFVVKGGHLLELSNDKLTGRKLKRL